MSDKEGRIRQRAYEIWQRGGEREGSHLEHWFQASREINAEEETGSGAVVERSVEETASSAGPEDASSLYEPDAGLGTARAENRRRHRAGPGYIKESCR